VRLVRLFSDNSTFALKVMKKSLIIKHKQLNHIINEVHLMSIVKHPFITELVGHFQDENRVYMVMEFVSGGELFTLLRNERIFNVHTTIFYTAELVCVLQYLHGLKIVYRDLKPENVLIAADGHIKLCDFGLSKIVQDRTWTMCGTAEYLAPEIIENAGHGLSVDWWALGVIVYEMLAGHPPFSADTPYQTYQRICAANFSFEPTFDKKAKDFVSALLQKDRRKRLGCGKGGAKQVKTHRFLMGIDWAALQNLQAQVPYLLEVKAPDDASNFQTYPDSIEDDAIPLNGEDREKFNVFHDF
jgi:serine/threonine protein kinase